MINIWKQEKDYLCTLKKRNDPKMEPRGTQHFIRSKSADFCFSKLFLHSIYGLILQLHTDPTHIN